MLGLGHTGRAYTIPIWLGCELKTIRFRRDDELFPKGPKYWGLPGYNDAQVFMPRLNPFLPEKKALWCEGELDATLAHQLGYNSLTLTNGVGADFEKAFHLLAECDEIRLALDQDGASYERMHKLHRLLEDRFPLKKIIVCRFDAKDLTDLYLEKGMDGMVEALGDPNAS
jgi:hypothetical protein